MITIEKLNILYDHFLNRDCLTTKLLNEIGFSSYDITKLIENNIIKREKKGLYLFLDYDGLLEYGKQLISLKEYDKGNKCFEKCFIHDPSNTNVAFRLLLRAIDIDDYNSAFKLCDIISRQDNIYYNSDVNFYLFLLSQIADAPEEYVNYTKFMHYSELELPTNYNNQFNSIYNDIRAFCLKKKFKPALSLLIDTAKKKEKMSIQDIISIKLLSKVVDKNKENKNIISEYIIEKKYNELIRYLEDKKNKQKLGSLERNVLILSKQYLYIKDKRIIPKIKECDSENLFDLINAHDYKKALDVSCSNWKENASNEKNLIRFILEDICDFIKSIEYDETIVKDDNTDNKNDIISNETSTKKDNNQTKHINIKDNGINDFVSVISYLLNDEIDKAFECLNIYMDNTHKGEFKFLIVNLIKLGLLKKDFSFSEAMIELSLMNKDNYNINISKYIQEFYLSISEKKYDKARIYLDILSKSNDIGICSINLDNLYKLLSLNESDITKKNNNNSISKNNYIEKKKNQTNVEDYSGNAIRNNSEQIIPIDVKRNKEKKISTIRIENDKKMIEELHCQLKENKGILLLKPMSEVRINSILDIIKNYSDLSAFTIIDDGRQRIVLKYQEFDDYFSVDEHVADATQYYKNGEYDKCIEIELNILKNSEYNKASNYSFIGLSYMKLHNRTQAIDYLKIANYLAKVNKKEHRFDDLILYLTGGIDKPDRKPKVKFLEEEFDDSYDSYYYGISNFDFINSYIVNSGLDVESACIELGLSNEDINIINLIYAKEYYKIDHKEIGDLFLKYVEQNKDKSTKVKKILDDISKNKALYKHKKDNLLQLSLTLFPKKK